MRFEEGGRLTHVNRIMIHIEINNSHVDIILIHVCIIHYACRGNKNAIPPYNKWRQLKKTRWTMNIHVLICVGFLKLHHAFEVLCFQGSSNSFLMDRECFDDINRPSNMSRWVWFPVLVYSSSLWVVSKGPIHPLKKTK